MLGRSKERKKTTKLAQASMVNCLQLLAGRKRTAPLESI
jgi:hypothetical protein